MSSLADRQEQIHAFGKRQRVPGGVRGHRLAAQVLLDEIQAAYIASAERHATRVGMFNIAQTTRDRSPYRHRSGGADVKDDSKRGRVPSVARQQWESARGR